MLKALDKAAASQLAGNLAAVENTLVISREWIYTAITRARSQVVLVVSAAALRKGIQISAKRTTGFGI